MFLLSLVYCYYNFVLQFSVENIFFFHFTISLFACISVSLFLFLMHLLQHKFTTVYLFPPPPPLNRLGLMAEMKLGVSCTAASWLCHGTRRAPRRLWNQQRSSFGTCLLSHLLPPCIHPVHPLLMLWAASLPFTIQLADDHSRKAGEKAPWTVDAKCGLCRGWSLTFRSVCVLW